MKTIHDARISFERGDITAQQLVRRHLDRLEAVEPKLHAVITKLEDRALDQARAIDTDRQAGKKLGPLAGIPFTAKDMFMMEGVRTTAASQILDGFVSPYTGTAVAQLEAAGAICIAKVNQDEFAHGGSTEYSSYGPTHNPYSLDRVPGGSSGGSAAILAAGVGLFSIGTDTGGSIRQPAAFCGVVGLKPTYGVISRYGVVAMASSLDVVGPFANCVEDTALLLGIMAGRDEHDATTIGLDEVDFQGSVKPRRVAIVQEYVDGLEPEIKVIYEAAFERLRDQGWDLQAVKLSDTLQALSCYYVITPAEVSSNLERYDGIRYGASLSAGDVTSAYNLTRGQKFGPEVQRRILTGTYALSAGYYDAYYKKAMQVRTLIRNGFSQAFDAYDILIGPTTSSPAFRLGDNTADPVAMYLTDMMTVGANLAGIPAISIPLAGPDNLPLGLQLMAAQQHDKLLLQAATAAQSGLAVKLGGLAV